MYISFEGLVIVVLVSLLIGILIGVRAVRSF